MPRPEPVHSPGTAHGCAGGLALHFPGTRGVTAEITWIATVMISTADALQSAYTSLASGDLQHAARACQEILEHSPEEPDALHLLGMTALQAGDLTRAIALLERAIGANPSAPAFHANLAVAYGAANRFQDTVRCLNNAIELEPRNATHHLNLGLAHRKLGDADAAASSYRRSLEIDPAFAPGHNSLGRVLKDRGDLDGAAASYRQAIRHQPGMASAHDNLGCLLKLKGDYDQAIQHHREAVRLSPRSPGMRNNLAVALKASGQYAAAEPEYREALRLDPRNAGFHKNLGVVLQAMERTREAADTFENAHRLHPNDQGILFNLATSCAQLGELERARRHYESLLELNPDHASALSTLNEMSTGTTDDDVRRFQAIFDSSDMPPEERMHAGFSLGKIYDRQGEYDRAFTHYAEANRLSRDPDEPSQEDRIRAFESIRTTFTRELFERAAVRGSESDVPVFIVGMPRSGTSLVEQILSSHPDVHGAGELMHIRDLAGTLSSKDEQSGTFRWKLGELEHDRAAALAEDYLAKLRITGAEAVHVTDKAPLNFLFLGLIALLLPNARVIHIHRHPLDVCLSNFFNNLPEIRFSFNLEHMGTYYAQYVELMDHWREVLPSRMLEVRYEELVEHQERVSRELIEFCGLDWDDQCLDFHRNDRAVKTASMFQVRQPMYASSVGRWKLYDRHLDPLKRQLRSYLPEQSTDCRRR